MLFFGISGSYGGSDMMSRAIASGVGGGIISELQGGKFGHGFASAGVGSLAGNFAGKVDQNVGISIKRTVVAALAGGTASAITGGKFGNGALTAAMSQAFGDWAQREMQRARANSDGEWIYPDGGSTDLNDYDTVMTNGILGNREEFVKALNSSATPAAGYFNPSQSFFADLMESFGQKFFGWAGDPLAADFANSMLGVDHPMRIIAHSQGTLSVANAVRHYGMSARGSTFVMKGPALSYYSASRAIQGRGGTMDWRQPYGDIANIYAPSLNPVRWASGFGDIFCGACRHIGNRLP